MQLDRLRILFLRAAREDASRAACGFIMEPAHRLCANHQPREQFRILFLDKRNVLMLEEIQATGTIDHAPVYPREVVRGRWAPMQQDAGSALPPQVPDQS